MARTTVIAPEAWEEIEEAFDWYERQESGLGDRFLGALKYSIDQAKSNPEMHPRRFDLVRRIMLRRFPYAVFFEYDDQSIYVHCVFHESRNPSRLERLKNL